jgi:signal transduction histidine kinase
MIFFDPTTHSMFRTIQRIELTLLSVSIAMHLVSIYVLKLNLNNLYFIIFCLIVVLLSFTTPLNRSIKIRSLYALFSMSAMIAIEVLDDGSGILFYWTIVKFSFFLPLRHAISVVIISGIAYISGVILNYPNIIASNAQNGVVVNMTVQALAIANVSSYTGTSILCVLLSHIFVSEQRSRLRAEILTKEIETLTADLERKRISRDIHDALGHSLTTLDIQLELAQKLRQREPLAAFDAIDRAKILTTQCLQDVRLAVQKIRKEPIDLNQSLAILIDRLRPHFNIHIQLDLPILPIQPSHQIYCILQEGFTNIQKHSAASEISLRGWYDKESLWLELADNGNGFEPTATNQGFGLRNMTERTQLLGGQMEVKSSDDRGTCICLSIPLVAP